MATVYHGTQLSLQRPVAIKVLKQKLLHHAEIRHRFEQESLIIARLHHPNIVHIIDQGVTEDERPYFVMEYVKSITLKSAMQQGNMSASRALDIFLQISKALAYAHKNNIVHCDIKPENILVDFEGFVHVLDFGIAQIYEEANKDNKTNSDFIMGSVAYMAPEQHHSITAATEKSDLYSLGVIMYLFFTKIPPKGEPTEANRINPDIPDTLNTLIMQCLQPQPQQRPESADEVKNNLLRILKGRHLNKQQQQRAKADVTKTFQLLDVIKENEHGAVYLFAEQGSDTLFVIKKKPITAPGYEEARRFVDIQHPNIVPMLGTSRNARSYILVMHYCNKGSLADRLNNPLSMSNFLHVALAISRALSTAHKAGCVHGNLRPTNVLFDQFGQVKVGDFGLDEHYRDNHVSNWYTREKDQKSPRSDIYSAGVIFYQMLTGELPRWNKSLLIKPRAFQHINKQLRGTVEKMLSLDNINGYASFDPIIKDLQRLSDSEQTIVRESSSPSGQPYDETYAEATKDVEAYGTKLRIALLSLLILTFMAIQAYFVSTGDISNVASDFFELLL